MARTTTALLLTLLIVPAGLAPGCKRSSDEQQIREMIEDGARLAADHDVPGILSYAAPGFEAQPLGIGRNETSFLLVRVFRRFGTFQVLHPNPAIEIDAQAQTAKVEVPFIILRADQEPPPVGKLTHDPIGWFQQAREVADPYALELRLDKSSGSWRVKKARVDGTRSAASF